MGAEHGFRELAERVRQRRAARVTGLAGLGLAHATWSLARIRPVVLLTRAAAVDELVRDLRFIAGAAAARVLCLPADDRTPFHASSPDPLVVMERVATLHKVASGQPFDVLVLPAESACRRGMPFERLQRMAEIVVAGEDLDRAALQKKLAVGGYTTVNTVEDPGSVAVRGGIIDIYWAGAERPVRIDLFGDTVESIRPYDPATQRTVAGGDLPELNLGPAREVQLDDETVACAKHKLRDLADHVEFPTKKLRGLMDDLDHRVLFFGVEGLLPAFYPRLETPLEVVERALGADGFTVVLDDPGALRGAIDVLRADFDEHRRQATGRGDLCFPVEAFLLDAEQTLAAVRRRPAVEHEPLPAAGDEAIEVRTAPTADVRQEILRETMRADGGDAHSLLLPLVRRIQEHRARGRTVLLPTASLGGVERLRDLLRAHHLEVRACKEPPDLLAAELDPALADPSVHAWTWVARPVDPARGAELPHVGKTGAVVVAEEEIFGKRARRGTGKKPSGFKTTLADLNVGDAVVHVDHGVGIFNGLTRLNVRGIEGDYLLLTYDGGDKLYLPVHHINLVQPWSGAGGKPRLDKLGGTGWETTKKRVKAAVMAMAQDLLALYSKREIADRPPHPLPDEAYWQFEAQFPFEPTPDQQKAIDDVGADMRKDKPMDRLICGDVGYGKTEVGMRAAMVALTGNRQVAVLAPTTVLAQQHFQTFSERFKGTAANIEVVSRFKKPGEVKDILERAKDGRLDILIGTHRLLSPDVSFKRLGLILVDEEQRFGVKAKEQLKRLKTDVDVLTLTATPIPRTLQMAFFGIRDMSVIETPPVDRRAIRTSIIKKDDEVIREAVLRELSRGGQVYVVHNRVRSIQTVADWLKRLVPEARVGVGHGQMSEEDLEDVMLRFMKHEINVLVCTAIIETGIDVPTANTMFIDHAEDFGLAQLYQLRGRVGRSKERAFAYLLIEGSTEHLHPDARKRMEILQRFSELGAGFQVAQHDLELRGAGDLLGKSQHGHVTAVGYDLYADLLREAVEELKGRAHDDTPDPDVNLPIAALIPDKYIVDLHERLHAYQRLATAKDTPEIYDVLGSLADLYGDAPPELSALADVMALKLRLKELAARGLEGSFEAAKPEAAPAPTPKAAAPGRGVARGSAKVAAPVAAVSLPRIALVLGDRARLDPDKLAALVASEPERLRLTPQMKLVYTPTAKEWRDAGEQLVPLCREFLRRVTEAAGARARVPVR
ncbi:MAG: transcription-repair coupling factor [Deltaproteobacteria bacterium]|nr:transcription-repair coupling factor [Deltaproteobacteria bacterium]